MLHLYLEFTRYCQYQYCMVSGIQKGGRGGGGVGLRDSGGRGLREVGRYRGGGMEGRKGWCRKE